MTALRNTKEDRRTKRHSVAWNGIILVGANQSEIRCIIKDISTIGVQLTILPTQQVPDQFHLKIPNGAKTFRCRLIWRNGSELGAEFVGTRPRWRHS